MSIYVADSYAKEERLSFPAGGVTAMVISGYAEFENMVLHGHEDSDVLDVQYTLHLEVGPWWTAVRDVSPTVVVAGYRHGSPDEADQGGWTVDTCTWEAFTNPNDNKQRIRLLVTFLIRGGPDHHVHRFAYHLTALGRL
jgi:hypothetical protein